MIKSLVAGVAIATVLGLGTTQASAASSPFAPERYEWVSKADKAFLKMVNGHANRMNSAVNRGKRCSSASCQIKAMSDFGLAGNHATVFIPLALKYGVANYQKPGTGCVRKVGSAVAYMGSRAEKVSEMVYVSEAGAMKAIRQYNVALNRAERLAKVCRKAVS